MQGGRFSGWYIRWYEGGKRRIKASKQPSAAEAKRMLQAIEGRIARGLAGLDEPAPLAPTVAELADRFLVEYNRPKIKRIEMYRSFARTALRRALPYIGEKRADALRAADVVKLRETLRQQFAANSVRLTIAMVGTVFNWAVKASIISHNPARGVELPSHHDSIEYLSTEEVKALLAASERLATGTVEEQRLRALVASALFTGMRKGELMGLRWQDLDIDTRRLTIARSYTTTPKSDKARHLRLPDGLAPILAAWAKVCPRTADRLVFPGQRRTGTWGMVTDRAQLLGLPELLAAAGCREFTHAFHALRHTFASHYVMQGGSLLALSKILGHSDIKVTMVYAHLAPDFIGAEMNRLKF
jgi:integrase